MIQNDKKLQRKIRVRSKIKGTGNLPRLCVYRSNKYIYVQLIDDDKRGTILGVSEKHLDRVKGMKKSERARALGELLAKKAAEKKIKKIVFDRGSYPYRGRVMAVAQGAREGGLEF